MSRYALSTLLVLAASSNVLAQGPPPAAPPPAAPPPPAASPVATPLVDKHFSYPSGIPDRADPDTGPRGTQTGYNKCNSTTEGPNSLCQTAFVNSADDFCLWSARQPNSLIGDSEAEEVAWCTKPGRGTRLIPPGALQGVQFMKTPDYLQVVGFIDQEKIDLKSEDFGGELDPHGADFRGNPLGGLVYSTGFPSSHGDNNTYTQVIEWHNFMGGGAFCFKVCDPAGKNAPSLCQHIFDRIGCAYNAPNAAQKGVFESCQGENQDPPGVFTSNGQVQTYTQPAESLGPITSIPYTARVPASSNCVTFQSEQLFSALGTASSTAAATTGAGASGSNKAAGGASASKTGSSPGATSTGAAMTTGVSSSLISLAGVALAIIVFA